MTDISASIFTVKHNDIFHDFNVLINMSETVSAAKPQILLMILGHHKGGGLSPMTDWKAFPQRILHLNDRMPRQDLMDLSSMTII